MGMKKHKRITYRRFKQMADNVWWNDIRENERYLGRDNNGWIVWDEIFTPMDIQFKELLADLIQEDLEGKNRNKKQ